MAVNAAESLRNFLEYMLAHGPEDFNEHRRLQSRVVDYVQKICSLYPEMRLVLRELVTVNGQLLPPANYELDNVWPAPLIVKLAILWLDGEVRNILGLEPPPLCPVGSLPPPVRGIN